MSVPSVLFVCLGNICRSPLAEGMMRHLSTTQGLDVTIDSAGTGDWHAGEPPDPRAIAAAQRAGFDISGQRARQVTRDDFRHFAFILAMDGSNLSILQRLQPDATSTTLDLLLNYAPGGTGRPVPDPYYGLPRDFDSTVQLVRSGCEGLLPYLRG
jgi:protein-tyrosine phosphatase